jgi:hypothetical protein
MSMEGVEWVSFESFLIVYYVSSQKSKYVEYQSSNKKYFMI